MILLKSSLLSAMVATAVYVLFLTFRSDDNFGLASLWAEFWPSGATFGVLYGVISYLISLYKLNKSQGN